jgi:RHS repeat-associated protein
MENSGNGTTYHLYDVFGRECITGITHNMNNLSFGGDYAICTYTGEKNAYMGYVLNKSDLLFDPTGIIKVNYYDHYKYLTEDTARLSYTSKSDYGIKYISAIGLLTGTITARLGEPDLSYDRKAFYYDNRNRLIQTVSTNYLGGYETEDIAYNYNDQPIKRQLMHSIPGKETLKEEYEYTYDHTGRPLATTHKLNDGAIATLSDCTYDEQGRLLSDRRNGNSSMKTDYSYNIRSWTKSISNQLFGEKLYYNDRRPGSLIRLRYGGNISSIEWNNGNATRAYDLQYDSYSQLIKAEYSENGAKNGHYSTSYSYDSEGNIQRLTRNGKLDDQNYGLIDDLTYSYNGNQLQKVTDAVSGPYYKDAFHFIDGADVQNEYEYDKNGNMTKDLNKGISNISFNLLNLPNEIAHNDGNMEKYIYSADGNKLRTTYTVQPTSVLIPMTKVMQKVSTSSSPASIQTLDYCGNTIYNNGSLSNIQIQGGFITKNGNQYEYHYYIADHLGNNRIVASNDGTIEQTNHYYPFGTLFGESTNDSKQRYKYNGKELDRMNGLNLYDYGARNFDAALTRWTCVDPMCEKYYSASPYVYCANNPLRFIDSDGQSYGEKFVNFLKEVYKSATVTLSAGLQVGGEVKVSNKKIGGHLNFASGELKVLKNGKVSANNTSLTQGVDVNVGIAGGSIKNDVKDNGNSTATKTKTAAFSALFVEAGVKTATEYTKTISNTYTETSKKTEGYVEPTAKVLSIDAKAIVSVDLSVDVGKVWKALNDYIKKPK